MANLNLPPGKDPISDPGGFVPKGWRRFFEVIAQRLGGNVDNVALALSLAQNAVPQTTEIVTVAPNVGGGPLTANVIVQFGLGDFLVADLPTASLHAWAFCMDGRKSGEGAGAGTGIWAWSDGNAWLSIDGGVVAA